MDTWFVKLSNKKILIFSAILTILLFLSLRTFDEPLHTMASQKGIVSFEFAKNIETSNAIILSWDKEAKINAGLSLGIDFLFLFAYSIFFATLCFLVAHKFINHSSVMFKVGLILAYLQFIAALFDAIENVALVNLLLGSQNEILPPIAFYFASIKFALIGVGVLYILIGYIVKFIYKD